MPVHRGIDSKTGRPFFQWGQHGKKYFYTSGDIQSRQKAKAKAARQGRAIEFRKHHK